jgi:glucose-6-phosphate 1-dehydrogenase
MFEPIWSRNYVRSIQITMAEKLINSSQATVQVENEKELEK